MDIAELLAFSVKNGASDLHLSAGLPPMIRVDGDMRRINIPELEHMASGNGEGFLRIISYDDISKSNSATATCVEVSPATASFVYPLNPYKQDSHTVSEDAETIKR